MRDVAQVTRRDPHLADDLRHREHDERDALARAGEHLQAVADELPGARVIAIDTAFGPVRSERPAGSAIVLMRWSNPICR